MTRKILAILLCLALVFTSGSFALANDGVVEPSIDEQVVNLEDCEEGCEDCEYNFVEPVFYSNAAKYIETIKETAISPYSLKRTMMLASATPTSEAQSEIKLNKVATANADGSYTLTLESYVTGSSETITNVKKIPSDIVLVLDESGSMDNCIVCGKEKNQCIEAHGADGYKEIYASDMDPANASNYYYKTEDSNTYYKATYCNKKGCSMYGKWIQNTNNHKGSGAHNSGSERAPKTKASDSNKDHYQYYVFTHVYQERYESLDTAVSTFLESIYEDAKGDDGKYGTSDDVTHRVAIVGFGDKGHLRSYVTGADSTTGKIGTAWKGGSTKNAGEEGSDEADGTKGYLHKSDWNSKNYPRYLRLLHWANNTTEHGYLTKSLNAIGKDNGSTYTELGLDAARAIFSYNELPYEGTLYKDNNGNVYRDTNGRNRVVVMFTDGAPTHGSNYFSNAKKAIGYANDLKNDYGAAVYTVGIFNGSDASNPQTLPTYWDYSSGKLYPNSSNATNSAKGIDLANRFMHLVSSNYPNATAMEDDKTGSINSKLNGDSYYLSAGDANELSQVFQKIYESISSGGTESTLTSTAVVKDIVADSFEIPEGATAVEAYSVEYKGNNKWATTKKKTYTPTVDRTKNTVTVSGFNYKENYVGLDYTTDASGNTTSKPHGQKLVLKIKVTPKEDFLGGDGVYTNTGESGIYTNSADTTPEALFPMPKVNVPLKTVSSNAASKNIYLSQQASLPEITDIGRYVVNGTTYAVDGINNKYVDIKYTLKNGDEEMVYIIPAGTKYSYLGDIEWENIDNINTHPVLTSDTTYTVSCDVISVNKTSNIAESVDEDITVNVYKPEITFNDSLIYLGQTANYKNNGGTSIVWKHGKTVATDAMGTAPTLVYEYSPVASAFEKDTTVKVSKVTAKKANKSTTMLEAVPSDLDITSHVTFYRDKCNVTGCTNTAKTKVTNGKNFVVHVKSFDLVIEKTGADKKDPNQSYIFKVEGPNNLNLDVVIVGNDTKTIKNLPVGEYKVTEVKNWSWRYTPAETTKVIKTETVMGKGEVMTAEFSNSRTNPYWLSGDYYIYNLFDKVSKKS